MRVFNNYVEEFDISRIILEMNKKNLFDNYHDNHFLIKVLNGELDYFDKYKNLIKKSMYYSDENSVNAQNFLINFSAKLKFFYEHFNSKDIDNFIKYQLSGGGKSYREEQFFRAFSEIQVLNFLMAFGPSNLKQAIYEPKLGKNGSNPEARLIYKNDVIVDVEVKTPGFGSVIELKNKGVLLPNFILEEKEKRLFEKKCTQNGFEFILPRVGKLKDYINSAGKKMKIPNNKKHLNLLFINWTYTDIERRGYLEPYSLLYNNMNGILKNKKAALKIGIEEEALEKISAIIVYQDSFDSLIFGDFRHVWNGYNFRMLPNSIENNKFVDIDILRKTLHMNPPKRNDDMMPYEIVTREEYMDISFEIADFINRRVKSKIRGEDNFTYFDKRYYKKKLKKEKKMYNDIINNKLLLYK